jgi:hypothetical protein
VQGLFEVPAWWSWLLPSLRPVGAAGWPLALMRSANRSPDRTDHGGRSWVPGERSDRSCHHLEARPRSSWQLVVRALPSRVSCRGTIGLAAAEHRPDDPRQLVGERRDHDVERPARPQPVEPRPQLAAASRADLDQGARTVDQLAAQVSVAAFAQAETPLLAAGGVRSGDQAFAGRLCSSFWPGAC